MLFQGVIYEEVYFMCALAISRWSLVKRCPARLGLNQAVFKAEMIIYSAPKLLSRASRILT